MPYRYLEDIATADVAFEAWGETIGEMFTAAALALVNVMVSDLDAVSARERRTLALESDAIDMLLFELLQELIFLKDAEKLLLLVKETSVSLRDGTYGLEAVAEGEELDPEKHDLVVDVKAVTLHHFKVEQTQRGWEALVILDI